MSETSPSDLFELVGQEARMAIVRTLLAERREADDPHLSFTELKNATGIEDTGRFNYHLGKLVGTVVMKTDGGYRLSRFGFRVLGPMNGGMYETNPSIKNIEVPGSCHECGESLKLDLDGAVLQVVCTSGHMINRGLIGYPDALTNRTSEEAVQMLGIVNMQAMELGVSGVCPLCHGRTKGGIEWDDEGEYYAYRAPCEDCGNQFWTSVGSCVTTHPAVVEFFADQDIDIRQVVPWSLSFRQLGAEEVVSEVPLRLRVRIGESEATESLDVVIDKTGSIVSTDNC